MIIPYKKITINSDKKQNEIFETIYNSTQTSRPFFIKTSKNKRKKFIGKVDREEFSITKNSLFMNCFAPQINGKYLKNNDNTKIEITFKIDPAVIITYILVFSFFPFIISITLLPIFLSNILLFILILTGAAIGYSFCALMFIFNLKENLEAIEDLFKNK